LIGTKKKKSHHIAANPGLPSGGAGNYYMYRGGDELKMKL
jgi:hypothetical protein